MRRSLALFALIPFLLLGTFGFVQMMAVQSAPMHHCPFMPTQHSACPMTALDHFVAWQKAFQTIAPELFIGILFVLLIGCVPTLQTVSAVFTFHHQRSNQIRPPPFAQLFSDGILHPKVF